jgi:hypothetical protein
MKMKTVFLLMLLLLAPHFLIAQNGYVTVTATVPNYAGGQATGSFVNQSSAPQLPLLNGSVFATTAVQNMDNSGKFTMSLADNLIIQPTPSQWQIIICAKSGNQGQPCYPVTITITCVGGGCTNGVQDISTAFSGAPAPPLPPGVLPIAPLPGQILTSTAPGRNYAVQPQFFYAQNGDTISSIESQCSTFCTYVVTTPQTITLSADHTLSSKVWLYFTGGGKWTVSGGHTLTIPGQVNGTLSQHFSSSGIKFGAQQALVPVEWFGAVPDFNGTTGTDNTATIQAALNSLSAGQILLQQGKYAVSGTLTITASYLGIKGTIAGGAIGSAVATLSPSVIINTTSTADTLHVGGTGPTAMTLYNPFDHFALERSVSPLFSAAGMSLEYAAGTMVEYVQSMDSGRDFYFHSAPGFGIGAIKHTWAGWGYLGVVEQPSVLSLTGYFLDSTDGNAENSITIEDSAATSPLSSAVPTYGMFIVGTSINDVDVTGFGTGALQYGIWMQYTGPPSGIGAQDIHFVNVTNDGCWINCILIQNVIPEARGSIDFDGGWSNSQPATALPVVNLFQTAGVTFRGMQISNNNPAGLGFLLNQAKGNTLVANKFIGPMANDVFIESGLSNVINDNSMTNTTTTAVNVINVSSHNSIIGNMIGGDGGTIATGINFDSSSQFNIGASYDNTFATTVTVPFTDPSGLNGGFFPTIYNAREFAGGIATPTVAAQSTAGAGATASLVTGSNDVTGAITLTTGTSPSANSPLVHLTFGTAKLKTPVLILQPANAATGALGAWTNTLNTSAVSLNSGTAAPAASTTYVWDYFVPGLSQ